MTANDELAQVGQIYMVVLTGDRAENKQTIGEHLKSLYGDYQYMMSDSVYLVMTKQSATLLAANIGIVKEAPQTLGAVFSINGSIAGYENGELWAWIRKAYDDAKTVAV